MCLKTELLWSEGRLKKGELLLLRDDGLTKKELLLLRDGELKKTQQEDESKKNKGLLRRLRLTLLLWWLLRSGVSGRESKHDVRRKERLWRQDNDFKLKLEKRGLL
jgi:hypothetical protein